MRIKKRNGVMLFVSLLLAMTLSFDYEQKGNEKTQIIYNIYFGLNDMDIDNQKITMDGASDYMRSLIEGYGYGYTEYCTYGMYMEDAVKGKDILVYMLVFM